MTQSTQSTQSTQQSNNGPSNNLILIKKKKRKRLSKSERKRRKRARELLEQQQQQQQQKNNNNKNKNDKVQPNIIKQSVIVTPSSPPSPSSSTSSNSPIIKNDNIHENDKTTLSLSTTKTEYVQNTNNNNNNDNNANNDNTLAYNTSIIQDTNNLLQFVYPTSNTTSNHKNVYIHSKLRHYRQKNTNNNNHNNMNDHDNHNNYSYNSEREKAISMGIVNESIDDIFFTTTTKTKTITTTTIAKTQDEKMKENTMDGSITSNDNIDNKGSSSTSSEEQESDSQSESSQYESSQAEKDDDGDEEDGDDNVDKSTIDNEKETKTNIPLKSTFNETRKRSMSEDSINDHNSITSKQLSGISIEMALQDKVGRRPRSNSTDGELNLPRRGLCDEQEVMSFYQWDVDKYRPCQPRGFHNLGNTCFLNATLQCLAHLPTFCQCVVNIDPKRSQNNGMNNENGKRMKLSGGQLMTMALRKLLRNVHGLNKNHNGGGGSSSAISPKDIANSISLIGGSNRGYKFRPGRQEDAHEFLVHLLDAMNMGELRAAGINPKKSGWRDSLPIPRLDETTFVHRMFGGYLRSQVCCTKCDYKSNTYDPFLDLSLEVSSKKVNCVYSALKEYTRKETLDAENKWKCSGCNKRVCATKQLTCFRPPLSLCIQLKRFSFGSGMGGYMHHQFGYSHFAGKGMGMMQGGSKIQKSIDFPAELKLPLSDGRNCEYQLTGVVIHVGHSATSGHYTAFIRRQMKNSHQWYHMDDSFVEQVKEKTVLRQRDAYVLFYCRKEVKLNLPNPPSLFASAEEAMKADIAKTARTRSSSDLVIGATMNDDEKMKTTSGNISEAAKTTTSDQQELNKPTLKDKTQSKDRLKSEKVLTSNLGTKRGSVKVLLGKLKRVKKVWKPSLKESNGGENTLLGNANVAKWDDEDNDKDKLLRESVANELKQEQKNRKRKMYLNSWDASLDKGRVKKVKTKTNQDVHGQLKPDQNQFHRIQHGLSQIRFRGSKHSQKKRRR